MKPRVAVSACLIGLEVRWDGTHKRTDEIVSLADVVELVPVCPEDEIGMGTPREPIKLVNRAGERHLVGTRSKIDHTDAMRAFAAKRVADLATEGVDGWILKARSPSCGLFTVNVEGEGHAGRGMFAQVVTDLLPNLPVTEENAIDQDFIDRVRRHWRDRTRHL